MEEKENQNNPELLDKYASEAEKIIEKLKNDPEFCREFFFGTKKKKCTIASMRSKMIYDFKKNHDVCISNDKFSSIVYLALWKNGTWSPLDSYDKRGSFFVWLKTVAKNAILKRLEEDYEITGSRNRTAGNTRLKMLSQPPETCRMVIDNLMADAKKQHKILTLIYVDRLPEEDIIKQLKINKDEWADDKKEAENKLKDAMIRSPYGYMEDFLNDKKKHSVTVFPDFVADLAEWHRSEMDANPLADVFGNNLSDEEVHEKVVEFLYKFSANLGWDNTDRHIWLERFLHDTPPVDLAKEVGHTRGWIDTRYSRLNQKFNEAIKKWWMKKC